MTLLNDVVFQTPLTGEADFNEAGGATGKEFVLDNPLPPLGTSTYAGIEWRWQVLEEWAWYFGLATWEAASAAQAVGVMPFQRIDSSVIDERSAKLSYNEMFVGAERTIWHWRERSRFYVRLGLHNVFDIDYQERHVLRFLTGDAQGFSRTFIVDAHASSVLMTQFGLGMEWQPLDRFSIGINGSYALGVRKFYLRDRQVTHDFRDSDGLRQFFSAAPPTRDGRVGYRRPNGDLAGPMPLSLQGWKAFLQFSVYY
ncbi:MAG TPA: hypothetical protein ENJ19_09205 [Gammaproteobacteria bacterium]|nr:hypothetical protein [Gammaproteobacteria bacterium]